LCAESNADAYGHCNCNGNGYGNGNTYSNGDAYSTGTTEDYAHATAASHTGAQTVIGCSHGALSPCWNVVRLDRAKRLASCAVRHFAGRLLGCSVLN
jgi:hypothetical protein